MGKLLNRFKNFINNFFEARKKKVKRLWVYCKALRRELWFLFFLAFAVIIVIEFWLVNIPEYFPRGAKIGTLVSGLAFAIISAFVFYFIVVHVKEVRDRENLNSYVRGKVKTIINSCTKLISEMAKASKVQITGKYPNCKEIKDICKAITPCSEAPLEIIRVNRKANWIEFCSFYKNHSNIATAKINLKMPFLETELVKILAEIDDSKYFNLLNTLLTMMPFKNEDLSLLENSLIEYINLIKTLESYYEEKLVE